MNKNLDKKGTSKEKKETKKEGEKQDLRKCKTKKQNKYIQEDDDEEEYED